MKRITSLTVIVLITLLLQPAWVGQTARAAAGASPQIITEADGFIVRWVTPPYRITPREDGKVDVAIQGYGRGALPGQWDVPQSSHLAAVPRDAQVTYEILAAEAVPIVLPGLPNRVKTPPPPARGLANAVPQARPTDQPVFAVQELGVLRGVRLIRLVFTPLHALEDGAQWEFTRVLAVKVRFNRAASTGLLPASSAPANPLVSYLSGVVLNPAQVQAEQPALSMRSQANAFNAPPAALLVEVFQPGLAQVRYADLEAAGWDMPSINPHRLQLWKGGVEVAMEWLGDDDDAFEPDEWLRFYAEIRPSRWTKTDVYQLNQGDTNGKRMASRPAVTSGLPAGSAWFRQHAETNRIYTPGCICGYIPPGPDGDHWVWEQLTLPGKPSSSFTFQLSGVDAQIPGRLTVAMIGYTDILPVAVDHQVHVQLNGSSLGQMTWNGKALSTMSFTVPAGVLLEGQNTLTLTLPGIAGVTIEGAWLDSFTLEYARQSAASLPAVFSGAAEPRSYTLALPAAQNLLGYDITDLANPLRLTGLSAAGGMVTLSDEQAGGRTYFLTDGENAPSSVKLRPIQPLLTGQVTGADYVIITHPNFRAALDPLIALRASQGLSVVVEDVLAIYDHYNGGRPDPQAIHDYLSTAYHSWNPAPTYVLLVGDGNYDPLNHLANSSPTYIPPFLENVDPWAGETASDNRFVTVDGTITLPDGTQRDDTLPDMLIGRLPVNSLEEAAVMVSKITRYELTPPAGNWPQAIAIIADDPDLAGNFPQRAEELVQSLNAPYRILRHYYTPPSVTAEQLKQAVTSTLNNGAGLIIYSGHSSIHQWAEENFFHISQVAGLQNGGRLPVILEMTCFTSSFQTPGLDALDEAFLRLPGGGAVATWGSTGLGLLEGHEILSRSFVNSLYQSGSRRLGMAALAGKITISVEQPANIDLLDTFTILGDPATMVNLATSGSQAIYLPAVQR